MYPEILNRSQENILLPLATSLAGTDFYLAGGTALALQVGHRASIDFDWFASSIGDLEVLCQRLRRADLDFTILSQLRETLYIQIEDVQVSFIGYRYPLVGPLVRWDKYNIQLASLSDIACMKLSAITNRGSRKDFIDLHYLLVHFQPLEYYLDLFRKKYQQQDIGHVIRSLAYFDDAETEPEIETSYPLDWQSLKRDLETWVQKL